MSIPTPRGPAKYAALVVLLLACAREAAALDPSRPLVDYVLRLWR